MAREFPLPSTPIPHYESRLDFAKTRLRKPQSDPPRHHYRPSWKPKNTLTNGYSTYYSPMDPKTSDHQRIHSHTESKQWPSAHPSEDNPRTAKKRRIDGSKQDTGSNIQLATAVEAHSPYRNGDQTLQRKAEGYRSRRNLSPFGNSEYLNIETMMRSRTDRPKNDPRALVKKEGDKLTDKKSGGCCAKGRTDSAPKECDRAHSVLDLVNLSSEEQFSNTQNLRSVIADSNIPSSVPRTTREHEVLSYTDSSCDFAQGRDSVKANVQTEVKHDTPKEQSPSDKYERTTEGATHPDSNLRHSFIREVYPPEQCQKSLELDELHANSIGPQVRGRTSMPDSEDILQPRKKLVHMLRVEDNVANDSTIEEVHPTRSLGDEGSTASKRTRWRNGGVFLAAEAQSDRRLVLRAVSVNGLHVETSGAAELLLNKEDGSFEIIDNFQSEVLQKVNVTEYTKATKGEVIHQTWLLTAKQDSNMAPQAYLEFTSEKHSEIFANFVQCWLPVEHEPVARDESLFLTPCQLAEHDIASILVERKLSQNEETQLLQKRGALRARRVEHPTVKTDADSKPRSSLPSMSQIKASQARIRNSVELDASDDASEMIHPIISRPKTRFSKNFKPQARKAPADHKHSSSSDPHDAIHRWKPWNRPLLFPANDPGKAVVEYEDLRRLDENEFLNDSLLTFGLKYYEHQYQNVARRPNNVYIFNTFFYEKLCATQKGKADINYEGVKRWTSKVDIFSYDYVIVPINEAAHWYGALVCNLTQSHKGMGESQVIDNGAGIIGTRHNPLGPVEGRQQRSAAKLPSSNIRGPASRQGISMKALEPSLGSANVTEPNEFEHSRVSSEQDNGTMTDGSREARAQQRASSRRQSPIRRSRRRAEDPHRPVIILLDSFGENHPAAARKLNQYLHEEGRSKHGFELETLPCVNARGIPLQPNAFDCGVYFLAYIQKFFDNPEDFVAKAVAKSFNTDLDFAELDAPRMRQTIREILQREYKSQSEERKELNKLRRE